MPAEPMVLLQGTLDVLILRALAWEPMHGYAVTRWIRERTNGTIDIEDARCSIKSLHRPEQRGCVGGAEWGDLREQPAGALLLQVTSPTAASSSRRKSPLGAAMPRRYSPCWSRRKRASARWFKHETAPLQFSVAHRARHPRRRRRRTALSHRRAHPRTHGLGTRAGRRARPGAARVRRCRRRPPLYHRPRSWHRIACAPQRLHRRAPPGPRPTRCAN